MSPLIPILRGKDKTYSRTLNGSGEVNVSVDLNDREVVSQLKPVENCLLLYIRTSDADHQGTLVWAGPIWGVEESRPEGSIRCKAVGFMELMNKSYMYMDSRPEVAFKNKSFTDGVANWIGVAGGFLTHYFSLADAFSGDTGSSGSALIAGTVSPLFNETYFWGGIEYTMTFWIKQRGGDAGDTISVSGWMSENDTASPIPIILRDGAKSNYAREVSNDTSAVPAADTYVTYSGYGNVYVPVTVKFTLPNDCEAPSSSSDISSAGKPTKPYSVTFLLTRTGTTAYRTHIDYFNVATSIGSRVPLIQTVKMFSDAIIRRLFDEVGNKQSFVTSFATVGTMPRRTRTYRRWQNLGQAIKELTEIENGVDIDFDPATRTFRIWGIRGEIKPSAVLGYNFGPSNVATLNISRDGSYIANAVVTTGKMNQAALAEDTASIQQYGRIEDLISLSDVVDSTILGAYANVEVALRAKPKTAVRMSLNRDTLLPHRDFDLGDKLYLTATDSPLEGSRGFRIGNSKLSATGNPSDDRLPARPIYENQLVRVFGWTLSIDEGGSAQVTDLQTSPA